MLTGHNWLPFYMQATAGVIAVLAAVVIHFIDPSIDSSRVVVSVIIVMLAGMTSTGAIQDAITGWYLTALARLFEAVMNTIGLIVGIAFGILVADRLAVDLSITANVSMGSLQLPVLLLASAFAAISFSFVAQNPARILLPTALLSAIGYAVYLAAGAAQLGTIWSSAAAAFVIGIIAVLYTQWFKAPAAAFAICAILPLLPGGPALSRALGRQWSQLPYQRAGHRASPGRWPHVWRIRHDCLVASAASRGKPLLCTAVCGAVCYPAPQERQRERGEGVF